MTSSVPVKKFGLEIPALTAATKKMRAGDATWEADHQAALQNNMSLMRDAWNTILANGGLGIFGDTAPSIGIIAEPAQVKTLAEFRIGLTFYATDGDAQKIAAAFPVHQIIDAATQQAIAAHAAAEKPAPKKTQGPKP